MNDSTTQPSLHDTQALSACQLSELSALFSAIMAETRADDKAHRLASLGVYVCDDWCERAEP